MRKDGFGRWSCIARCAVLVVATLAAWQSARAEVCALPSEPPDTVKAWVRKGHERKFADLTAQTTQKLETEKFPTITLGDSIMQRWPTEQLSSAFGSPVLNSGVGGDITQFVLWRLQNMNWSEQSPKYLFLLVGTNNTRRQPQPDSACDTYWGIRATIDKSRALFPSARIIVSSILPRGEGGTDGSADIATVNQALREASASGQFSLFDAHDQLICKDAPTCELTRPPKYVHPTPKGYVLLTKLLHDYVANLPR
jgi:lysophospholipase L1-like esterase